MVSLSLLANLLRQPECPVKLDARRCLRNRSRSCHCRQCIDGCPGGALRYDDNRLQLDSERCRGCLRCTAVCPSDALLPGDQIDHLLSLLLTGGQDAMTISCARQRRFVDGEVALPCLAALSEELVLLLALHKGPVILNTADCRWCANSGAIAPLFALLDNLHRHPQLGDNAISLMNDELDQTQRRSFLLSMKEGALAVTRSAQPSPMPPMPPPAPSTGQRRVPARTGLRQQVALRLTNDGLADRLTPQLQVTEQCRPCLRCSGICPTGALQLQRVEGEKELLFDGGKCSACGLCLDYCRYRALSLSTALS